MASVSGVDGEEDSGEHWRKCLDKGTAAPKLRLSIALWECGPRTTRDHPASP